jgi:glycosyltransferase involved in cell wall biosynthesis
MREDRYRTVLFSVVVPVYNKRPHVRRAVLSVLAQGVSDFELLLIDDASTDGSMEEIADLDDPRIRRLRRETPGPGGYAARNLGIREARAEWIAFLDADDEWAPGLLAEYIRLIGLFPSCRALCSARADVFNDGSRESEPYGLAHRSEGPHAISLLRYAEEGARGRNPIQTSAFAARRELLLEAGGFPEGRCSRGGDRETWLRLLARTDMAWSPYLGAVYYRNAVNMVTKTVPPLLREYIDGTYSELIASGTLAARFGPGIALALKRLSNADKKHVLKRRMRSGEFDRSDLSCLYKEADIAYYAALRIAALLPGKAISRAIRAYKRLKSGGRTSQLS